MGVKYFFLIVSILLILFLLPKNVSASHVQCGQTIGPGLVELDSNIVADGTEGVPYCLRLNSGTTLDCKGFSIIKSAGGPQHGVRAENTNFVSVKNCIISNFADTASASIFMRDGNNTIIDNNTLIASSNGFGHGIVLERFNSLIQSRISENKVYNAGPNAAGIFLDGTNMSILIENNVFDNTLAALPGGFGIVADTQTNQFGTIYNSTIKNNIVLRFFGGGIAITGSNSTIENNYIDNIEIQGIVLYPNSFTQKSTKENYIVNNSLVNIGDSGIRLFGAVNNTVTENSISFVIKGISIENGLPNNPSKFNKFINNNISNVLNGIVITGGTQETIKNNLLSGPTSITGNICQLTGVGKGIDFNNVNNAISNISLSDNNISGFSIGTLINENISNVIFNKNNYNGNTISLHLNNSLNHYAINQNFPEKVKLERYGYTQNFGYSLFGKITYLDSLNLSNQTITTSSFNEVFIGENLIFVNSTLSPSFNKSAELVIGSLNTSNPRPLVDLNDNGNYVNCTNLCSTRPSKLNTLKFEVLHFTSYKTEAGEPFHIVANKSINPDNFNFTDKSRISIFFLGEGYVLEEDVQRIPLDVMLSIDSSGSMTSNDPTNLRLDCSKLFVDELNNQTDRSGVVSWDDNIDFVQPLTNNFTLVKQKIDQIDSSGGTNLDIGLSSAIDELESNGKLNSSWSMIFLTDGVGTYTPSGQPGSQADRAASLNLSIFTICLQPINQNCPSESILIEIANVTGGKYFPSPSSTDLESIFLSIAEQLGDFFAAKDIIVTDILDKNIKDNGNYSIPPNINITNSDDTTTLVWNIDKIDLGESIDINFSVSSKVCGSNINTNTNNSLIRYTTFNNTNDIVNLNSPVINVIDNILYTCSDIEINNGEILPNTNLSVGGNIFVNFDLVNNGNLTFNNITIRIDEDDGDVNDLVVPELLPFGLTSFNLTWNYTQANTYSPKIILDPDYTIPESNIGNNKIEFNIEIIDPSKATFVESLDWKLGKGDHPSALFADVDNDGDLDAILTMGSITENVGVYLNNGSGFQQSQEYSQNIYPGSHSSIVTGDINNDGYLDLVQTGRSDSGKIAVFINNGSSLIEDNFWSQNLPNIQGGVEHSTRSSASLGDFNNDGNLDLAVIGVEPGLDRKSKVFKNTGDSFIFQQEFVFPTPGGNVSCCGGGAISFSDIDNNGYNDIVITGLAQNGLGQGKVFLNNKLEYFVDSSEYSFEPLAHSNHAVGDIDNDGYIDLVVGGFSDGDPPNTLYVYRNNGSGFEGGANLAPFIPRGLDPMIALGDIDNNGFLDIAFSTVLDNNKAAGGIYLNNGTFFIYNQNYSKNVINLTYGSNVLGDVDNDEDLDLLTIGITEGIQAESKLYLNKFNFKNTKSNPPNIFNVTQDFEKIILSWDGANDSETSNSGLYYNLRVGTCSECNNIVSGEYGGSARPTYGYLGNMMNRKSIELNVPPEVYYWSVQSIDAGLEKSNWSSEQIVNFSSPKAILNSTFGTNKTNENLTLSLLNIVNSVTDITDWRIDNTSMSIVNFPFDTTVNGLSNTIKDYSSYNHIGILTSGPPLWTNQGIVGGAYEYDGNDDYTTIPHDPLFNSQTITVEVWAKSNGPQNDPFFDLVDKSHGSLNGITGWVLQGDSSNGGIGFIYGNGVDWPSAGTGGNSNILDGNWHHIVGTLGNGNISMYIDGILINSAAYPGTPQGNSGTVNIGAWWGGGIYSRHFNGIIDEVKVYNRALSSEQIYQNYLAGISGKHPSKIISQETKIGETWQVYVTPNNQNIDGTLIISNSLLIRPLNSPPNLEEIGNKQTNEGSNLFIQLDATDPDNDNLTYYTNAYSILPTKRTISFNSLTGLFEWIPSFVDSGNYTLEFNVSDGQFIDSVQTSIEVLDSTKLLTKKNKEDLDNSRQKL